MRIVFYDPTAYWRRVLPEYLAIGKHEGKHQVTVAETRQGLLEAVFKDPDAVVITNEIPAMHAVNQRGHRGSVILLTALNTEATAEQCGAAYADKALFPESLDKALVAIAETVK